LLFALGISLLKFIVLRHKHLQFLLLNTHTQTSSIVLVFWEPGTCPYALAIGNKKKFQNNYRYSETSRQYHR